MRKANFAVVVAGALALLLGGCSTTGGYLEVRGDPAVTRAITGALGNAMIGNCQGQSATVTADTRSEFSFDLSRRQPREETLQINRRTECGK
jgi:hypothetical protein